MPSVMSFESSAMPAECAQQYCGSAASAYRLRAITAGNTAASLYSDARESIARLIQEDVARQVTPRGIVVENCTAA